MCRFGQVEFWKQLLIAVGGVTARTVLKLPQMFKLIRILDSKRSGTRNKLLPMFRYEMHEEFVKNKSHALLMVCLDSMSGSGTDMLATIKSNYGDVVKQVLPSRRKTVKATDILRIQFLEECKPTSLPRGMRVSLVAMVGHL